MSKGKCKITIVFNDRTTLPLLRVPATMATQIDRKLEGGRLSEEPLRVEHEGKRYSFNYNNINYVEIDQ